MSRRKDLEQQLTEYQCRLHKREMQRARYGYATEPHMLMEIEDITAKVAALEEERATLAEMTCCTPYRGLCAFRPAEEPVFFCRKAFTAHLVARG